VNRLYFVQAVLCMFVGTRSESVSRAARAFFHCSCCTDRIIIIPSIFTYTLLLWTIPMCQCKLQPRYAMLYCSRLIVVKQHMNDIMFGNNFAVTKKVT
jgi:hypothetical protein